MAINLQRTSALRAQGIKMLGYGQAGSGKTTLIKTLPNPVVFSAEAGLLSIADQDIPFIEVTSIDTMREAYEWLIGSDDAKQFDSIALDSISEIAEVCLANEKAKSKKDPRAAYGEMQVTMAELVRTFRDIKGKHVYMTAKQEKTQDEMGRLLYSPSMPGQKAGQNLPYQFDLVFAVRMERDEEGKIQRALMCESDGLWQAKSRIAGIEPWEAPDLGALIAKIEGAKR